MRGSYAKRESEKSPSTARHLHLFLDIDHPCPRVLNTADPCPRAKPPSSLFTFHWVQGSPLLEIRRVGTRGLSLPADVSGALPSPARFAPPPADSRSPSPGRRLRASRRKPSRPHSSRERK